MCIIIEAALYRKLIQLLYRENIRNEVLLLKNDSHEICNAKNSRIEEIEKLNVEN